MKLPLLKAPSQFVRQLLVQPVFWALFFLSPVLNAFRVDMLSERVVFWGQAYPFSHSVIQWIPIGFYGGVLAIAVTSLIFGRLFCGWSCPHNTLTEWTRPLRALVGREPLLPWLKRLKRDRLPVFRALQVASPLFAVALTGALSGCLASYVEPPPTWILSQYASGQPHIALVFGQALFTLIGLFLLYCGHDFCRTCCPYGMGQSVSAYVGERWRPMEIGFKPESQAVCKTCTACQQVCPVDIDPRKPENLRVGQFDGCFNCGACVDACNYLHSFKKETGFLGFHFPVLGGKKAG